jgi:hypothetical protein
MVRSVGRHRVVAQLRSNCAVRSDEAIQTWAAAVFVWIASLLFSLTLHRLHGCNYAREEFELKDRPSDARLRRLASPILDFDFFSRLAPPCKQ